MSQLLLITHIVGAGLISATAVRALFILLTNNREKIPPVFYTITLLALLETASGTLLGIIYDETFISFCSKIGIYLFVVIALQISLLARLYSQTLMRFFTITHTLNAVCISAFIIVT